MTRAKGRRAMADSKDNNETKNDDGTTTRDVKFYNIFDGIAGRSDSTYLDIEERIQAEKARARAEGREPDLSDPGKLPAGVGTPFVIEAERVDNRYYSNPSINAEGAKDVDPVATAPVTFGDANQDVDLAQAAQVARERNEQNQALLNDTKVRQSGEPAESGVTETGPSTKATKAAHLSTNTTKA